MQKAKFVKEIVVTDPDSGGEVHLSVFKHENGGMFAIDSSFIEQCRPDEGDLIPDPFADLPDDVFKYNDGDMAVMLIE